jgi:ubiquinol-cytochrome c reductase cytochrome b subunit
MHILREVYFGWSFRYLHSSGASFLFLLIFLHLGRALIYGSNFYMPNTWFSGIFLLFTLGATAFMGYVLPWGQMSFWGATVITNLFSGVPCLVFWVCGGFFVSNPSLSRFFVFHFLLPFLICGFIFLHLFYLHTISSKNPLGSNPNNKIPFFPFISSKDVFGFSLLGFLGFLEIFFGFISLSHPENAFEVSVLVTPLHIVPEWYFLEFYALLKAVPNKIAGFMILFSSVAGALAFGEVKSLSRLVLSLFGLSFSVSFIFLVGFCFLWIGAQLPQEKFISGGRFLSFSFAPIMLGRQAKPRAERSRERK